MPAKGAPRSTKKSPRKKTGCLTCRARHMRCDEARPKCSACVKAGLSCECSSMIVYAPETQVKTPSHPSRRRLSPGVTAFDSPLNLSQEIAYLLRQYQDGIGVWMDLFDHECNFCRLLLTRVAKSPLLKHSACALAARQKALLASDAKQKWDWNGVAERHYGDSLTLLRDALDSRAQDRDDYNLPASTLLLSYELMSYPGDDYTRHFYGARSLIESYSPSRLQHDPFLRSAYWIFIRHDVDVALMKGASPTLHDEFCYEELLPDSDEAEVLGNKMLLLTARVLRHVFGQPHDSRLEAVDARAALLEDLVRWVTQTKQNDSAVELNDGSKWYSTPAIAAGMQLYHASKLILAVRAPQEVALSADITIQESAEAILAISQSFVSDAVQVQAVHTLFLAAKYSQRPALRQEVLGILTELQQRTGFHTQSKIDALKRMM